MTMWRLLSWSIAAVFSLAAARAELNPASAAWVDSIWHDHLMQRGGLFAQQPVVQEAFYRDALKVDPRSPAAVEGLARRFRANDEYTLAAAAAGYGRFLKPDLPVWDEIWAWAWPHVEQGAVVPMDAGSEARYKAGLDAMLAYVKSNQFLQAELEVRILLREMPRDIRLMENVATFARMADQTAMAAMAFGFMLQLHPTHLPVANNFAAMLEQAGLPGPAYETLARFVPLNPADAYLLNHVTRLADALRRHEDAARLAEEWRQARPDDAEAWMVSARAALSLGKPAEALVFWAEARQRAKPGQVEQWLEQSPFAEHRDLLMKEAAP